MPFEEIVTTAVVSTVVAALVSGVLVFAYQQLLMRRLERERGFEQHTHEVLVSAYAKIWAHLVDLEYWLKHVLPTEGLSGAVGPQGVLDPKKLFAPYFEIEKNLRAEALWLPDALNEKTESAIAKLVAR
jgi:hypothetical protein